MVECAYCEHALTCDSCRQDYRPAQPEDYRALSSPEEPVLCPSCGQILVCHWCKTPYDGIGPEDSGPTDAPG